jgi:hypothetical protein
MRPPSVGAHDNRGRPHTSLDQAFPTAAHPLRCWTVIEFSTVAAPVLVGLHHEYRLERVAA